ncbi:MAG: quinolinate synthase NadA [Myxococcota bacterium]|nr:quinolinate synthase NadA [Myxococcota bacterium]MDW8363791.1 quinolinate synthase NadA [Myxococcales bacterium]
MMPSFPSIIVERDTIRAEGAFAVSQAAYLDPDPALVAELDARLVEERTGVVAHYYMDPELQGALAACPRAAVHIADSLAMAEQAVEMARRGARRVLVLGVDFMAENARATLDAAGFEHVPVYRVVAGEVGCSLAAAADAPAYLAWLQRAARQPRSVHVVYVNTSLTAKARAEALLPTIACTSSNVVRTLLSLYAELPGVHVWFGPDSYMGRNLEALLRRQAAMGDETVRGLHAGLDAAALRDACDRFHAYPSGTCIVHEQFGASIVERVRRELPDADVAAHLEVPGEMFDLALERASEGRGVVGSTSNILEFIVRRAQQRPDGTVRVVLGTETGMVGSIVRGVRRALAPGGRVEIVFPVAAEAIRATQDPELPVVPGGGGEGCTVAGGCATCPYMKMSSLDALMDVVRRLGRVDEATLAPLAPRRPDTMVAGRPAYELGRAPIAAMRELGRTGRLPEALRRRVLGEPSTAPTDATA